MDYITQGALGCWPPSLHTTNCENWSCRLLAQRPLKPQWSCGQAGKSQGNVWKVFPKAHKSPRILQSSSRALPSPSSGAPRATEQSLPPTSKLAGKGSFFFFFSLNLMQERLSAAPQGDTSVALPLLLHS